MKSPQLNTDRPAWDAMTDVLRSKPLQNPDLAVDVPIVLQTPTYLVYHVSPMLMEVLFPVWHSVNDQEPSAWQPASAIQDPALIVRAIGDLLDRLGAKGYYDPNAGFEWPLFLRMNRHLALRARYILEMPGAHWEVQLLVNKQWTSLALVHDRVVLEKVVRHLALITLGGQQ